ncbi:hypothetical protein CI102_8169 [Trichoderma harzianum]|nr:hypothetical protein CI102_8169 [Trichoderma harzianum]
MQTQTTFHLPPGGFNGKPLTAKPDLLRSTLIMLAAVWFNNTTNICILVGAGGAKLPIDGTIIDWGTSAPDLGETLQHYQKMFKVQPLNPLKRPEPRRDNDDEGRDGGGSSGRTWTKQVYRDDYGGYYYIGQDEEYHQCDAKGKEIQSTEKSTGYRTSNPYHIVLVFSNAQKQTYYQRHGQPELCSLRKHSSGTYYFVDYKGRECNAQYVGLQPRWMNRKAISQSTGGQGVIPRPQSRLS